MNIHQITLKKCQKTPTAHLPKGKISRLSSFENSLFHENGPKLTTKKNGQKSYPHPKLAYTKKALIFHFNNEYVSGGF